MGVSLRINEISDDSDLLPSASFDPGSHVKLQRQGLISGYPDLPTLGTAYLGHRNDVHVARFILLGNSLRAQKASFLYVMSVICCKCCGSNTTSAEYH
jgi:hypothetical protein